MNYNGHPDQKYGHISFSHCAEDIMILNLFDLMGIEKPSYIDVGAHHPFTISNTALLYNRGSRGINIEANPNLIKSFEIHRPEDKTLNIGVGPTEGYFPFYMYDETSGRNTFSEENAKPFNHVGHEFKIRETKQIPVFTLNNVIQKYCDGKWPDLLCLDIEGLDEKVIMSTELLPTGPKIICIEAWPWVNRDNLKEYLKGYGYKCYCRLSIDLIFVDEAYLDKIY